MERIQLLEGGLFISRADAEEEIGLTEEGQAEGLVVDARRKLFFPGEDIGRAEAGAGGLGRAGKLTLVVGDLFLQGKSD